MTAVILLLAVAGVSVWWRHEAAAAGVVVATSISCVWLASRGHWPATLVALGAGAFLADRADRAVVGRWLAALRRRGRPGEVTDQTEAG